MVWLVGHPVVMFPTSMGCFFQYEDSGLVRVLADKVDAGPLQLVCVDSYDAESWYDEFVAPRERGERWHGVDGRDWPHWSEAARRLL